MIRTIVVDDSATVRQLLVEILEGDPEISVLATAANGAEAVELVTKLSPDLVVMDIHMPVMDGLQATQEIMVRAPTPILIITSATSQRQLELSLSAMQVGALLVLPKPENPDSDSFAEQRDQLVSMAKAMASVKVVRRWGTRARPITPSPRRQAVPGAGTGTRLIAVAASTGGPATLRRILNDFPADFSAPILVVQHLARGFVAGFARWLDKGCALQIKVAEDGEALTPRVVYIAPDDRHLGIDGQCRITLDDAPPIGGFRPSATYLFESVARGAGPTATAVVLTGMGNDGLEGLRSLYAAGGRIIAQDKASSVIYGMAQEAVRHEVVDKVLPCDAIAARLTELVRSGER